MVEIPIFMLLGACLASCGFGMALVTVFLHGGENAPENSEELDAEASL